MGATSMLEQDYSEDLDTEQAINLAMSIFLKTLDTQTLNSEKIEVSVVNRISGKVQYRVLQPNEVDRYCKKAEDEKKKKAKKKPPPQRNRKISFASRALVCIFSPKSS